MTFPSGWELILVLLVILVLFGAKRLPDSARALGRSMRILKAETKGMRDDDGPDDRPDAGRREGRSDTTVTAEPLPPAAPPAPGDAQPYGQEGQQAWSPQQPPQAPPPQAPGYGAPQGDQAQHPRP